MVNLNKIYKIKSNDDMVHIKVLQIMYINIYRNTEYICYPAAVA